MIDGIVQRSILFRRVVASVALLVVLGAFSKTHAQSVQNLRSGSGLVWRSGAAELCWRTSAWTPAMASEGCDGALVAPPALPPPVPVVSRPVTKIILLPDAGGAIGRIDLNSGGQLLSMSEAYQRTTSVRDAQPRLDLADKSEIDQRYGPLYKSLPKAPARFLLYFGAGSEQLTAASQVQVAEIRQQLTGYTGAELIIIGHTDRQGDEVANDTLSLRRANLIRDLLVAAGLQASHIETVGRGERDLLVPTADGVAEAANRRVEVRLR